MSEYYTFVIWIEKRDGYNQQDIYTATADTIAFFTTTLHFGGVETIGANVDGQTHTPQFFQKELLNGLFRDPSIIIRVDTYTSTELQISFAVKPRNFELNQDKLLEKYKNGYKLPDGDVTFNYTTRDIDPVKVDMFNKLQKVLRHKLNTPRNIARVNEILEFAYERKNRLLDPDLLIGDIYDIL